MTSLDTPDLPTIRARHVPVPSRATTICGTDYQPWPCDAKALLDRIANHDAALRVAASDYIGALDRVNDPEDTDNTVDGYAAAHDRLEAFLRAALLSEGIPEPGLDARPEHEGPHFANEFQDTPTSRSCPACAALREQPEKEHGEWAIANHDAALRVAVEDPKAFLAACGCGSINPKFGEGQPGGHFTDCLWAHEVDVRADIAGLLSEGTPEPGLDVSRLSIAMNRAYAYGTGTAEQVAAEYTALLATPSTAVEPE